MEKIDDVLAAHKQQLLEELAVAQAQVEAIKHAIARVDKMLEVEAEGSGTPFRIPLQVRRAVPNDTSYARKSIKDLVLMALETRFPNGATANEFLDHFANAYQRTDIARTSLSPQLSRLKDEGRIIRDGRTWYLPNGNDE